MRAGIALLVIASILAVAVAAEANAAPVVQGVSFEVKQQQSNWPLARRLMEILGFVKESGASGSTANGSSKPAAVPDASAAKQQTTVPAPQQNAAAPQKPAAPEQKPAAAPQKPAAAEPKPQDKPAAAPQMPAAPVQKPVAAAPLKPAQPVQKPVAAAPLKPAQPVQKPAAAAPLKPAQPVQKPAAAAPLKPAQPVQKPAAAAPLKPAQPVQKPAAAAPHKPAQQQHQQAPPLRNLPVPKAAPIPTAGSVGPSIKYNNGDNMLFDFLMPYNGTAGQKGKYNEHKKDPYYFGDSSSGGKDRYSGDKDSYSGGKDRYRGDKDSYSGGKDRYIGDKDSYSGNSRDESYDRRDKQPYHEEEQYNKQYGRDGHRDEPYYRGQDREQKPYYPKEDNKPYYPGNEGEEKPYYPNEREEKPYYPGKEGDKPYYPGNEREQKPYYPKEDNMPYYHGEDREQKPYYPENAKPYYPEDAKPYYPKEDAKPYYPKEDAKPYYPNEREEKPYYPGKEAERPYYPQEGEKPYYPGNEREEKPYYPEPKYDGPKYDDPKYDGPKYDGPKYDGPNRPDATDYHKSEGPSYAPNRPSSDHRGAEPDYKSKPDKVVHVPKWSWDVEDFKDEPKQSEGDHKYDYIQEEMKKTYKSEREYKSEKPAAGYEDMKQRYESLQKAYEALRGGKHEDHPEEYERLSQQYQGLKIREHEHTETDSRVKELTNIYDGMKSMFEEMKNKMTERDVQEKLKDLKQSLKEEEPAKKHAHKKHRPVSEEHDDSESHEKVESPIQKPVESWDKFADGNDKPAKQPEPEKKPEAEHKPEAEKIPEVEKKPEVESKPVEPGSKWSQSWEQDEEKKKEDEEEEEVLFGGKKYGYDPEYDGYRQYDDREGYYKPGPEDDDELDKPGYFKGEGLRKYKAGYEEREGPSDYKPPGHYEREVPSDHKQYKEEEYEPEYKEAPKRRRPRFVPGVADPADPDNIADPKCHIDFSPFYDQSKYKFACLGEKNRTLLVGTAQRPESIRSELTCCNPDDNVDYPSKSYGKDNYPEPLTMVEVATPAGSCTLNITYFDTPDLSKDGLCVGTIKATCHLEKPCHLSEHTVELTLRGVVKAKPAKIKVDTEGSDYYSSYGPGEHYLPGTALIAYITDAPTYGEYDASKVLLKYVINWYNDDGVVLPDESGDADAITPLTPVEVGSHSKLPMVEPGTFGLFIKHGYYGEGYSSYDYDSYTPESTYPGEGPSTYDTEPSKPDYSSGGPKSGYSSGPKREHYGEHRRPHKYGGRRHRKPRY